MSRYGGTGSGYRPLRQMILSARKGADRIRLTAPPGPTREAALTAGRFAQICRYAGARSQAPFSLTPRFVGVVGAGERSATVLTVLLVKASRKFREVLECGSPLPLCYGGLRVYRVPLVKAALRPLCPLAPHSRTLACVRKRLSP